MKLTFLGNGSAFNYDAYNTSAYFIFDNNLFLFDCGEGICNRLLKKNVLDNVNNIYIFITHLHSDHIGSLEALIYYNQKFLHKGFFIFYPKMSRLKRLLQLTGVDFPFEIYPIPNELCGFKIEAVSQKHIFGSYGYFFYGDFSFFYSGDTSKVNVRSVKELKNGKIDKIYHEVTCSTSSIHTHIDKLRKSFSPILRGKVCLMHFDNKELFKQCLLDGFDVAEVEE